MPRTISHVNQSPYSEMEVTSKKWVDKIEKWLDSHPDVARSNFCRYVDVSRSTIRSLYEGQVSGRTVKLLEKFFDREVDNVAIEDTTWQDKLALVIREHRTQIASTLDIDPECVSITISF